MLFDVSPLLNSTAESIKVEIANAGFVGDCDSILPDSINLKASLRYVDGNFLLKGDGDFLLNTPCARCLRDCDVSVSFQIEEWFSNRVGSVDEDVWHFDEHTIDLTDAVMTNVLISVPTKVLCADECLGLCSICGANLNEADCGCDRQARNPVFDSLRGLF